MVVPKGGYRFTKNNTGKNPTVHRYGNALFAGFGNLFQCMTGCVGDGNCYSVFNVHLQPAILQEIFI